MLVGISVVEIIFKGHLLVVFKKAWFNRSHTTSY